MLRQRALLFAAVLALCVGCDHTVKLAAKSALSGGASLSLLDGLLRLELVHNPGAFLSLGALLPARVRLVLFVGLVPLALAAVCLLAVRSGLASRGAAIGLGLVAGGGLGNWLDRLLHAGSVTDFVSVGLGPLRTGVFNVADVFIVAGVAWLALLGSREPEAPAAPLAPDAPDA
jgi:signal peptidase II